MAHQFDTIPRHPDDLRVLAEAARHSRYIGLLTVADLRRHSELGQLCLLYDQGHLVGCGAWQIIAARWCELGPYLVLPQAQSKGYGRLLLSATHQRSSGYQHFAITKNPAMAHLLAAHDLERVTYSALPNEIHKHLRSRLTPQRLWHLLRKFSFERPQIFLQPAA